MQDHNIVFLIQSIIKTVQLTSSDNKMLLELDSHLQDLLARWFSLGFLDLQQITWQSSCEIVEKVRERQLCNWNDVTFLFSTIAVV